MNLSGKVIKFSELMKSYGELCDAGKRYCSNL